MSDFGLNVLQLRKHIFVWISCNSIITRHVTPQREGKYRKFEQNKNEETTA